MTIQPSLPRRKSNDEVSYLQQDMARVENLVDKLDTTIDKLAEVSSAVSQLLAVHETKISTQEIISKQLTDLLERRRVETEDKIQVLHKRITVGEKELEEKIEKQYVDILSEIKDSRKEGAEQHGKLSDRINKMDRLIWLAVGGSAIIGILINFAGSSTAASLLHLK